MPTSGRTPRSVLLLSILAIVLAVATAGVAMARQAVSAVVPPAPVGTGSVRTEVFVPTTRVTAGPTESMSRQSRLEHPLVGRPTTAVSSTGVAPSRSAAPAPRAVAEAKPRPGSGQTSGAAFHGRNRMWMPALGIRQSVSFFSCSSNAYPGNRVYRWGCAGRNNVYLFGHAYSVFKPLHDAYVRGRLKKGMKVYYADGNGRVSTYRVSWWRVTTPDRGGFAYASQSRPSLTLQTCVGARSQYRLIVRLVKAG